MTMKERWKEIPGFPKYEVSDHGRIRTKEGRTSDRIIRTFLISGGLAFTATKNGTPSSLRVARLVGRAFCKDYGEKLYARYRDTDRTNCHYRNLMWVPRGGVSGTPYSKTPRP